MSIDINKLRSELNDLEAVAETVGLKNAAAAEADANLTTVTASANEAVNAATATADAQIAAATSSKVLADQEAAAAQATLVSEISYIKGLLDGAEGIDPTPAV